MTITEILEVCDTAECGYRLVSLADGRFAFIWGNIRSHVGDTLPQDAIDTPLCHRGVTVWDKYGAAEAEYRQCAESLVAGAMAWLTTKADALEPAVVADLHAAVGHLIAQPAVNEMRHLVRWRNRTMLVKTYIVGIGREFQIWTFPPKFDVICVGPRGVEVFDELKGPWDTYDQCYAALAALLNWEY